MTKQKYIKWLGGEQCSIFCHAELFTLNMRNFVDDLCDVIENAYVEYDLFGEYTKIHSKDFIITVSSNDAGNGMEIIASVE